MKKLFIVLFGVIIFCSCANDRIIEANEVSDIAERCKGVGVVVGECENNLGHFYTVKDEEGNYFTYLDKDYGYVLNDTIK